MCAHVRMCVCVPIIMHEIVIVEKWCYTTPRLVYGELTRLSAPRLSRLPDSRTSPPHTYAEKPGSVLTLFLET